MSERSILDNMTRPLSTLLTSFFSNGDRFDGSRAHKGSKESFPSKGSKPTIGIPIYDPTTFLFPVYCINSKEREDKKQIMYSRFIAASIHDDITFVRAVLPEMPIVDHYLYTPNVLVPHEMKALRSNVARFASHIKAVRTFLENSEAEFCLIVEDDVMFHNNFKERLHALYYNCPLETSLVSLCWMLSGSIDQTFVGRNCDIQNLWAIDPDVTVGCSAYCLTRAYALRILDAYDHPHAVLMRAFSLSTVASASLGPTQVVPLDIFVRLSRGYMASVPLCIPDCVESESFQRKQFCYWGWENYNKSDPDKRSPLQKMTVSDSWNTYPFRSASGRGAL